MSVMCSMQTCMQKPGMCGHEKLMLAGIVVAALGGLAYLLL